MFKLITDEKFIEMIDNYNLNNADKRRVYRLSLKYYLKSFGIFFLIILMGFFVLSNIYNSKELKIYDYIFIFIQILIYLFLIYYIYEVFSYKIIVTKDKIIQKNNIIDIDKITSLNIEYIKIKNKFYERSLVVETKDYKKYIFRLNIHNSICFIKQISILSNTKIDIKKR